MAMGYDDIPPIPPRPNNMFLNPKGMSYVNDRLSVGF